LLKSLLRPIYNLALVVGPRQGSQLRRGIVRRCALLASRAAQFLKSGDSTKSRPLDWDSWRPEGSKIFAQSQGGGAISNVFIRAGQRRYPQHFHCLKMGIRVIQP
jgi:hypothetical protein